MSNSQEPRTPTRGTPQRHRPRTGSTTPRSTIRISSHSKPHFKPPKAPDFSSLQSTNVNFFAYNPEKEPIKSYLRIRPRSQLHESDESMEPYLEILDDLEIAMTPPEDSNAYRTRNRAPERYKFTQVFTESVSQEHFFNKTTLPLIHDVLNGQNALIFAYGVTNSGKTYSIMGTQDHPGLLPRTLDVLFNSIDNYKSEAQVKPCMHSLVQTYTSPAEENRDSLKQWTLELPIHRDKTTLAIDPQFEYGIWVSFAEIYTEKIYDLLVSPDRLVRRKPLSLKYEYSSGHKYIAGLKEVKVKTIEEAYAVMLEGQRNRAQYSTLTNYRSSRSHSIFTVRIVRVPIDDNNYVIEDPMYATVSKLSIVDLAGSERYRNTLSSGQRLKEAGNINKSLMVLGQCMETLRLNQLKSSIGKRGAMVPYRHSKLTELFKSSFEGDGKAVMVVNVNPFDTGFDENSHVMKFAAVAKDVATWRKTHPKLELKDISAFVNKRLRVNSQEKKIYSGMDSIMKEQDEEEKAEDESDESDEEEEDPFVDNLISQLDDLRNKWMEAETRCSMMESDIRQQVMKDAEIKLKKMESFYLQSLKQYNQDNEDQINGRLIEEGDEGFVRLKMKQEVISQEIYTLQTHLDQHETTKNQLLEKINELERDKKKQHEQIKQLCNTVKERESTIQSLQTSHPITTHPSADQESTQKESTEPKEQEDQFSKFLDLRKRLRRSLFRGEEYSPDADVIMAQVEQFKGVTFELVKQTSMGKLMKLITERTFKEDPYHIQQRSKDLLKRYAKLSIPVLAPTPQTTGRGSMVVLSVNAGHEEELIMEMRGALSSLQEENTKLKQRLKSMQEGFRRLKEAIEQPAQQDLESILSSQPNEMDPMSE
ncbi:Kinesin-like protein KIF23 [Choanephora cucurbitarum]|uniref:Kinesin-like protein n=1 Tax=Choanephora cucurbitarum TaxID=101091 RepID=A0A1C7N9V4_9FUNG|nr:Kinesin-like protein KIF23 [Choanephora cucurbitarum]